MQTVTLTTTTAHATLRPRRGLLRLTLGGALLAVMLLCASCEKEISLDYHTVSPLYVAEATLTQEEASVRLSTTQNMADNTVGTHGITNAVVVLSADGDVIDTLRHEHNGYYRSAAVGYAGFTYQIDIYVDGHHFSSTSTMQEAPVMNSFRFVWKDVVTERMLFADLRLQDLPAQNNYYFMHIYRNGVGYRWAVMRDDTNPGGELQQLFSCTTERNMDDGEDGLKDGDRIRLEIRSIDKKAYDYFYSMQVMDNAGTNPVQDFTGGCLGYFSAYHVVTYSTVFRRSEVAAE